MKAVVTGATGFVGGRLCRHLAAPNILTRNPDRVPAALDGSAAFGWDPIEGPPPAEALEGCEAVFHLAGEPVAEGRWTAAKKQRIRDSRALGTRNLVAGLKAMARPPAVLVSASAVGFYGSRGDEVLTEGSSSGEGFLVELCREWESEALEAKQFGVRVVCIRIGLVLGKQGGALTKMLPLFKLAAGGPLGNGSQWTPWIHVDDLARLFLHTASDPSINGAVNGVAPNPVTNKEFTQALARAVRRPAIFPAPAFALRLALGEFAEVLLASQRVHPAAAEAAGFSFAYPRLDGALAEIIA